MKDLEEYKKSREPTVKIWFDEDSSTIFVKVLSTGEKMSFKHPTVMYNWIQNEGHVVDFEEYRIACDTFYSVLFP